jgi:GT2 family glycosyltransferase
MAPRKDIAILVPAYNASSTIRETLESIQAQQASLDRVLCVVVADDHSADDTVEVAKACWKSNVPLKVVRNLVNKGERTTTNETVASLPDQVEWFFILHADDLARPNWLEVMVRGIDQAVERTASLTASYDVLFPDGRIVEGENLGEAARVFVDGTPASIRDTLKRGCWFKISSCAIRVRAFREVGGFLPDMPQLGDWDFVLRLMRAGWAIEYIPLCLSVYRQSAQSVSSKSFREHRDVKEALIILEKFREYLPAGDMAKRHVHYLGLLARRAAASLVRRDMQRLRSSGVLSVKVADSMRKSYFRSN